MKKNRIHVNEIYKTTKERMRIGVHNGKIYIKTQNRNWKLISTSELAIEIRKLYTDEEQNNISVNNVKEVVDRLRQDPKLQLRFAEETYEKYVKLKSQTFNVETGRVEKLDASFGYFLNFDYIQEKDRRMPMFDKFIKTTFPEETETKRQLLLEIIGYTLSDYTKAKAAFFFVGESNSGKSTLLELIQSILPQAAVTTIPLYRLSNRFNLARIAESRVNICTELSAKSFEAADILKMLTSNEKVTAEHKGGNPFEFRIRCKSINAGNFLPDIKEDAGVESMVNRMVILLFPVSVKKEEQQRNLLECLLEEKNSIFSYAMDALSKLQKNKFIFTEPKDSLRLKKQILFQGKALDYFFENCCVQEKNASEYMTDLYEAFREYCEENLLDCTISKTKFSQFFSQKEKLVRKKIRKNGGKPLSGVEGIRLKKLGEYMRQDSESYSREN